MESTVGLHRQTGHCREDVRTFSLWPRIVHSLGLTHDCSSAAYRGALPAANAGEAQKKARQVEETAFYSAKSRIEYGCAIQAELQRLISAGAKNAQDGLSATSDSDKCEDEDEDGNGQTFGQYINAIHHATGLFSTIYKARPRSTAAAAAAAAPRFVALKITLSGSMTAPHDSKRELGILRFLSTPTASSACCSNIIPLLDSFSLAGGRLALVFPFIPSDLSQILHTASTTDEPLTGRQAISILHDLFSALAYIHTHGIIHRDVKPSNILLASPSGPAYLADFGIVWAPSAIPCSSPASSSEPATKKITDVGTTSYRPPELLFGHTAYDTTLDLWAAGCVTAEVLSSTFSASPTAHSPPPQAPSSSPRQQTTCLFDSGPLGSELSLIQSIFRSLGTPTDETWPEARTFPDWGKMQFHAFPARSWEEILPRVVDPAARDLVARLVRFESGQRMSAADVSLVVPNSFPYTFYPIVGFRVSGRDVD
ncbi:MAG: hypothetical protein M1825_003957 [Sarcosagium campestre]|nr:MAG: hypothetical protein M1825_003957 [Sarcosagium campestre]